MTVQRVAYVLNSFPRVSETFVAGEIAEMLRRGVDVKILSLRRPEEELRHDVVVEAGLEERTEYRRERFEPALTEFDPQILHAHFATKAAGEGLRLASELDLPFTFTAHRYDIYDRPPDDFAERAAAAGAVVTVSEANARYIREHFGVLSGRIRVIPCGVDVRRFRPNGGHSEPPLVVCVARLKPFKNQRLLLEACALLRERGVDFRCTLVGEGPARDELEALRVELGLTRVVDLAGAAEQAEVLASWQRAAVAALPSDSEGMPVCLMEAAACGVPAVATAVGGVPELVEDRVTGLLSPPGDSRAFADALERLLTDPDLAGRMGTAARRRAEERFAVGRQADQLLALWEELLE